VVPQGIRWSVFRVPALLGSLLLVVVACSAGPSPPSGAQPEPEPGGQPSGEEDDGAQREPSVRIVAKLDPIADLVDMVGGNHVEVRSLVPPGADSHTYEPRPSDLAALDDADAFVGVGLDLNSGAVSLAEEELPADAVILLGERFLDEDRLIFDHVHGDDGHTHGGNGHTHDDEAGPNPHVWTGLSNAAVLVDGIADALGELDPDHAADYRDAAAEARTRIGALAEEVDAAVETIPEADRTLVVYHDAWSYFARDHGLEMVTAVQPSDYSEPSAGDVRDIIDLVRGHGVPALFGSEVFPSDVLETIGEETGATYVGDLADDALPGEPGDPDHSYLGLMRHNAALVVENLGGDTSVLGG
jgi:ABC-type Zn uptake system ZnuABC Zn-binding protein ZnuA